MHLLRIRRVGPARRNPERSRSHQENVIELTLLLRLISTRDVGATPISQLCALNPMITEAPPTAPIGGYSRARERPEQDCERELAGDVAGKRVLYLACSTGDEVLSRGSPGATAIGAGISEVAIARAVRKAGEAGIGAGFHRADMLDLPAELSGLDLIYLSWGAICWVPDLGLLAATVAGRLRQRGPVLV